MQKKPIDAVVAITYCCNARCKMCNIWQKTDHRELAPEVYQNLSPSLLYVNLTGGEPFLRKDVVKIYNAIQQTSPKAKIIFSTNGLLPELILNKIETVLKIDPKVGVRVSIDAIGRLHSELRGIPKAYEKALSTLEGLKKIGVKNLGIGHTVLDENIGETLKVYELSQKLGVEFSLALAQNSEHYFEKLDNRIKNLPHLKNNLETIIRKELESFSIKRWGRAFFEYGAYRFALNQERILEDGAAIDSCFISPTGDVYPSDYINEIMGNISQNKLDQIWELPKAESIRAKIRTEKPIDAWMICTLRGSFADNKLKILLWALKNKLKSHLRQKILAD